MLALEPPRVHERALEVVGKELGVVGPQRRRKRKKNSSKKNQKWKKENSSSHSDLSSDKRSLKSRANTSILRLPDRMALDPIKIVSS